MFGGSNWSFRDVSEEAIRRIGPVPSLGSNPPVSVSPIPTPTPALGGGRPNLSNTSTGTTIASLDEFGGIRMPGDKSLVSSSLRSPPLSDTAKPTTTKSSSATGRNWPRAEDEKQRLFNQARQRADEMQDLAAKAQSVKVNLPSCLYFSNVLINLPDSKSSKYNAPTRSCINSLLFSSSTYQTNTTVNTIDNNTLANSRTRKTTLV